MFTLGIIFTLFLKSFIVFGSDEIDVETRKSYRAECLEISKFAISGDMRVDCYYNYHHYNSSAYKSFYNRNHAIEAGKVKIAEFNVLHPGMSKTRYKDYKKIAQLINRWDVVGVTELLPLLSDDLANNRAVVKFINETPKKIQRLKDQLQDIKNAKNFESIQAQIDSYESDLKMAPSLYRDPGYLKILKALHSLKNGNEWALVLAPRGQAAKKTDVQELIGYFYRSSKVKPRVNQYCKEIRTYGKGTPVACIPNMSTPMLSENKQDVFSRRPFMAEFISGRFSFVLLASHVVYNSPRDKKEMENILQKSFGVKHYEELGVGANAENYARFAEVKVTLEFMDVLRKRFNQQDIIFLGDLNLESNNAFWPNVLNSMPGVKLYNSKKTSLSEARYNKDGSETLGLANDFDHILLDPSVTSECVGHKGEVETKVENFYKGVSGRFIDFTYKVRLEEMKNGQYVKDNKKYDLIEQKFIYPIKKGDIAFETIGTKIIKVGDKNIRLKGIVEDTSNKNRYIEDFYERVLDSQFFDKTYYSYFKQLISDHMPISMECVTD